MQGLMKCTKKYFSVIYIFTFLCVCGFLCLTSVASKFVHNFKNETANVCKYNKKNNQQQCTSALSAVLCHVLQTANVGRYIGNRK